MHKINLTLLFFQFVVFANGQIEFITTWKTDNPGISENNQITIPTFSGETYNYTVDWGDGNTDSNITGNITHSYGAQGTYQVSIEGTFPRIYFNESGDKDKILNIKQWGAIQWTSMESAFARCSNLSVAANDTPDLSNVTSLSRMFFYCNYGFDFSGNREYTNFNGVENFNDWNVSTITDLSNMFDKSTFNQDISAWVVSNVTNMSYLFFSSGFNREIDNWDVSKVQNMEGIFGSSSFRGDVTEWDVSNVTNMAFMFNSTFFDQDISSWDVSGVTSMRHMLSQCSFNQDIGKWNVSNVIDMSNIFDDNDLSRENYDKILIAWSQLPSLQFGTNLGAKDVQYCSGKNARDLLISTYNWSIVDQGENCEEERPFVTTWKTDNPGPSEDNQITIPTNPDKVYYYNVNWGDGTSDTGVTQDITHTYNNPGTYQVSISGRFPHIYFNSSDDIRGFPAKTADAKKIITIDQWGTGRWTSMGLAFSGCSNLDVKATDIPDFSKDISLSVMFHNCKSLVGNETMSQWDLSDISMTASSMFSGATLFNQPIGEWDVSNVRYLDGVFQNAASFNQNLEKWDIGKVENMDAMFDGSGISVSNYDRILDGWSNLPNLLNNVKLGAINTNYCNGEDARQELINAYGWEITDAGKDCSSTFFITTWKTDNPGSTSDDRIRIPTFPGESYYYEIDWGDGTSDTGVTGNITHQYANPGTYTVSISGDFPRIYFNDFEGTTNDSDKIISVDQWGAGEWTSMNDAFTHCSNLDVLASDTPNLEKVNSLGSMFRFCKSLVGTEFFSEWDVTTVTDFGFMFDGASQFNQDISSWDVSNAIYISFMFSGATHFNADISNWDISNVQFLDGLFEGAEAFNQPIGNWNVQNLKSMHALFAGASSFNQDISAWNLTNVQNMSGMFSGAIAFDQDISNWDVSNVTSMNSMFPSAVSFNSPLNSWDVSSVTDMRAMFDGAISFNQPIGDWDVSNVRHMSSMFVEAISFNQPLNEWNVFNVTNMSGMFLGASSFDQDISDWNMSNVVSIGGMFNNAVSFNQNLGKWNIGNVTNMDYLFNDAGLSIENYDKTLIGWNDLQSLQNDVILDAGNSQFCEAAEVRQNIVDTYGWIISDGGEALFCNEDNDADGVLDHLDSCLNTTGGAVVDAHGCEIIPVDAISIYGQTPTCINESNGSIEISSILVDHVFTITIAGTTLDAEYTEVSLDEALKIENLPTGLYTIQVKIPNALYEQTFGVIINEVGSVTGKRQSIDTKNKTATYLVSGSHQYKANVNGKAETFAFDSTAPNEIRLTGLSDYNSVSISGKNDCQGKIEDAFEISGEVFVYPVMTKGMVFIHGGQSTAKVKVYDMAGRLIIEKDIGRDTSEGINLESYGSGMYPIKITSEGNTKSFKILKQ